MIPEDEIVRCVGAALLSQKWLSS